MLTLTPTFAIRMIHEWSGPTWGDGNY